MNRSFPKPPKLPRRVTISGTSYRVVLLRGQLFLNREEYKSYIDHDDRKIVISDLNSEIEQRALLDEAVQKVERDLENRLGAPKFQTVDVHGQEYLIAPMAAVLANDNGEDFDYAVDTQRRVIWLSQGMSEQTKMEAIANAVSMAWREQTRLAQQAA